MSKLLDQIQEDARAVSDAFRAAGERQGRWRAELDEGSRRYSAELRTDPHLILLQPKRFGWRKRRRAAREIAARMSTRFVNPKARLEVGKGSQTQRTQWVREALFVPALLEAAREWRRPRYLRLGRTWVTNAKGTKALVSPGDLSVDVVRGWLQSRAYAIAETKILGPRALRPLTDKQRDAVLLAAKSRGVTPDALKRRAARAVAKLHGRSKRSQGGSRRLSP